MKSKFLVIPSIVFLFALTLSPAFADGNDKVSNNNQASVSNDIEVEAETGENYADGSYGGDGGDGGSIRNGREDRHYGGPLLVQAFDGPQGPPQGNHHDEESGSVEESTTGNGAAGGNASDGGTVITGDAMADLRSEALINRNLTEINRCCGEVALVDSVINDDGNSRVRNINAAEFENKAEVEAETSENDAMGSYGGYGGDGGDVKNEGGDVDEVMTGDGAMAGNAALGGLVQTGLSDARADIVSRINENVTRIRR